MNLGDIIRTIFNSGKYTVPVPGQPGQYALTSSGDNAVNNAIAQANLPVIQYDAQGNYYLPTSLVIPGLGQDYDAKSGLRNAKGEDLLQWTSRYYGKPDDPLGLNGFAKAWSAQVPSKGAPVVTYSQIPTISLPSQPARQDTPITSPGLPTAMSGQSYIFTNGKLTSIVK